MKQGYKVVCVEGDRLKSACINGHVVDYEKDEITERPYACGPLTCFKTRAAARMFRAYMGGGANMQLWKCEYEESVEKEFVWNGFNRVSLEALAAKNKGGVIPGKVALAESIKLIKKVR